MDPTEVGSLVFRLVGDGSSYQAMLKTAQQATQATAAQVQEAGKKIEAIASSLTTFASQAVAALGAFGAATSLRAAFNQFAQAEDAMNRLTIAIKGNGNAVEAVLPAYQQFADTIARTTTTSKAAVFAILQQAEMYGLSGKAAQDATQMAIALAAAKGGEAASYARATAMAMEGNPQMLYQALGLRRIHDESQKAAMAQRILADGYAFAQQRAQTAWGQIEKLQISLAGLSKDVGQVVAEAIAPLVKWLSLAADAFKRLDPATKQVVVAVVALAAAVPLIGPAFSLAATVARTAFAPVVAVLGALLSPIGLVVAAVGTLTAAWLRYSQSGGAALAWFGDRWRDLSKQIEPGIKGMKDALMAGDLVLTFKILWSQVQLTFASAIQPLYGIWSNFVSFFTKVWAEASAGIQSTWAKTQSQIQESIIWAEARLGVISEMEARQQRAIVRGDTAANLEQIKKDQQAAFDAADQVAQSHIAGFKKSLTDLQAERDKLVSQAAVAAAKVPKIELPKLPPFPDAHQTLHIHTKFDATAFGSAEHLRRLEQYRNSLQGVMGAVAPGVNVAAPAVAAVAPAVAAAVPAAEAMEKSKVARDSMIKDLKDAKSIIKDMKDLIDNFGSPATPFINEARKNVADSKALIQQWRRDLATSTIAAAAVPAVQLGLPLFDSLKNSFQAASYIFSSNSLSLPTVPLFESLKNSFAPSGGIFGPTPVASVPREKSNTDDLLKDIKDLLTSIKDNTKGDGVTIEPADLSWGVS